MLVLHTATAVATQRPFCVLAVPLQTGRTPLHMAAQRNNAAAVRFLLNNGATKDLYKEDKVLARDMDSHAAFLLTLTHTVLWLSCKWSELRDAS